MRSFRRLVRSMVSMVCLPPRTAELEVTTIDVVVALVTLRPTRLGGEGGRSSHGRNCDGDDKKRFHGTFSRLHAEASAVASQVSAARYPEVIAARYRKLNLGLGRRQEPTVSPGAWCPARKVLGPDLDTADSLENLIGKGCCGSDVAGGMRDCGSELGRKPARRRLR
jgi:hypothetical protein